MFGKWEKGYEQEQRTRENKRTLWAMLSSVWETASDSSLRLTQPQFNLLLSCCGSRRKHKEIEKKPSKKYKQSSIAGGPRQQRCFHSKLLTEGTMSSSSGLVLNNTNYSVYQTLDCFPLFVVLVFFHYLLAEHHQSAYKFGSGWRIQGGTLSQGAASPPTTTRGETSQDGHDRRHRPLHRPYVWTQTRK